jgi:WD40 repeat protein
VAISHDNKYIVSASWDYTVKLWDVENSREIITFEGHTGYVSSVAISHDNKYIISGSSDSTLKLWDVESGRVIRTFEGHTGYVSSVAISHDNKYIVSGSLDNTVKLWNINNEKNVITIFSFDDGWVRITHDKYFDCNENGKKYINQRIKNPPRSIPISDEAFKKYHRPDIIKQRFIDIKPFEYEETPLYEENNENDIPF